MRDRRLLVVVYWCISAKIVVAIPGSLRDLVADGLQYFFLQT